MTDGTGGGSARRQLLIGIVMVNEYLPRLDDEFAPAFIAATRHRQLFCPKSFLASCLGQRTPACLTIRESDSSPRLLIAAVPHCPLISAAAAVKCTRAEGVRLRSLGLSQAWIAKHQAHRVGVGKTRDRRQSIGRLAAISTITAGRTPFYRPSPRTLARHGQSRGEMEKRGF